MPGKDTELNKHVSRFGEMLAVRQTQPTAWQMVSALIKSKHWSKYKFCEKTLLDEYVYDRAMSNHKAQPGLRTLMAIFVGMDTAFPLCKEILGAAGLQLDNSKEGVAFEYILCHMSGSTIHERNDFLVAVGVNVKQKIPYPL